MTGRNDLAGLRPDLAGRTGQNQPLDLATSPLPIGRRRRGEKDEQQTHTEPNGTAGEVNTLRHDHLDAPAHTPFTPTEIRRAARWLALAVYVQPRARRRQLIAEITAAAESIRR